MKWNKHWFKILLFVLGLAQTVAAQDVQCDITVNYSQVENTDPVLFQSLERALFEFINNRKWTTEKFKENERIEFSILLTIEGESGGSSFNGNLQVQSRRPVYGSSYYTPVLNHKDNDITFSYQQFDVLLFNENNASQNSLTALIAYYVYLAIGMDYDTFSPEGGTPYLTQALNITNQNVSSSTPGWKPFEDQNNRYWIIENYLEARFKNLRKCMYEYHRLGMDQMSEKQADARKAIFTALQKLNSVHQNLPNSINLRMFFNSKADEIVNIFKEGTSEEKAQIVDLLTRIDPGNIQKWSRINGR
jgi:hypothetical protein